jgi:thiosulfate dehydrogenase [quinone] large subunit
MRRGFEMRDETLAYALLRVTVGLNFMMHGVSRLLAGPALFTEKLVTQFAHSPLPGWSVQAFASALPFVEGILGLLLLLGLRTKWVLVALGLVMLTLTFGTTLLQDWSGAGAQLLYEFVLAAMLFLRRFDGWSVDACFGRGDGR